MSQFEVIKDIGETLRHLLSDALEIEGFRSVTVTNDKPKKENIKKLPGINLYLYHLGFAANYRERSETVMTTRSADGRMVDYYQDAPAYLMARYAVSTHGNSPAEEAILAGFCIKTLLENPVISGTQLKGKSFSLSDKIAIHPELDTNFNDTATLWRSLDEEIRPLLFYFVKFRIESQRRSKDVARVVERRVVMTPGR